MVTAELERIAPAKARLSTKSRDLIKRPRVLVLSATDKLPEPIVEMVESLGESAHVNFVVIRTGDLTRWLSGKGIYYYLFSRSSHTGAVRSDTTFSGFFELVHQLRLQYLRSRFDVAVFAGDSPYLVGARLAAWIAGVPARVSLAGCDFYSGMMEPHYARIYNASRGFDSEKIAIDPGYVRAVVGRAVETGRSPWMPLKSLAGLFVTFTLAWNFANMSQRYYLCFKRIVDVFAAFFLFCVAFPLVLLVAGLRLTRKQPAFTVTRVLSRGNKWFKLYSFGDGAAPPSRWQYRLWWLPSLINVMAGQLSFVGPRLLTVDQAAGSENSKLYYWINPGITGWSQMRGRPGMTDGELTAMDQLYIATTSPLLDFKIVLKWALKCVFPW